jgi:hypothetical protein
MAANDATGTCMFGDTYGATRDDVRCPSFAGNDAPLIGERAAARGRRATEGGDERAGMKSALSVRALPRESHRPAGSSPPFGDHSAE